MNYFKAPKLIFIWSSLAILLAGCANNGETTEPSTNSRVEISVVHSMDSLPLLFDTLLYTSSTGTKYSVSRCVFYLSDFTFYDAGGKVLFTSDSIFYMDARNPETLTHYIENAPPQYFHAFTFIFGLHPENNVQGRLPNTLENLNMFWPELWGGGYHFMKLEGRYVHSTRGDTLGYATHIGSNHFYSTPEPYYNYFVNSHLPVQKALSDGEQLNITLTMNLDNWYKNPTHYDFYKVNPQAIMEDQDAQEILKLNGSTDGFALKELFTGPIGALPQKNGEPVAPSECLTTPVEIVADSLPAMKHPKDNPLSKEGIKLGRKLFYDNTLAEDGISSCATCHVQAFAFSGQDKPTQAEIDRPDKAQIKIVFKHTVDSLPLVFDSVMYTSAAGTRYSISNLQYYLSDFLFTGKQGDTIFTSDSVFFLDAKDTTTLTHSISGIPNGYYRDVSFTFGLRRDKNITGRLPSILHNIGMGWPEILGGGYHFMKLEGTYIDSATSIRKRYAIFMGNRPAVNPTESVDNHFTTNPVRLGKQVSGILQLNFEVAMNPGNWIKNPTSIDFNQLSPESVRENQNVQKLLKSNGMADGFSIHNVFHKTFLGGKVFTGSDAREPRSLINLGWKKKFMGHGAFNSLEEQAMHAVRDELKSTWPKVVLKLKQKPGYNALFKAAFCTEAYDSTHVVKALAQFQRTLISFSSRYDKIITKEITATEMESNGFRHFFLESGDCFHCHDRPFFTDDELRNNGLDKVVEGVGRGAFTGNPQDNGKIVTPTLRNIALTAPYMRDGRFKTLEEVLNHYNSGGHSSITVDPLIRIDTGLGLSENDRAQIIAFLKTLTDSTFINNPDFGPPNY